MTILVPCCFKLVFIIFERIIIILRCLQAICLCPYPALCKQRSSSSRRYSRFLFQVRMPTWKDCSVWPRANFITLAPADIPDSGHLFFILPCSAYCNKMLKIRILCYCIKILHFSEAATVGDHSIGIEIGSRSVLFHWRT